MKLGHINGLNKDKALLEVDGYKNVKGDQANKILSFTRWREGDGEKDLSTKCDTWHSNLAIVPLSDRQHRKEECMAQR